MSHRDDHRRCEHMPREYRYPDDLEGGQSGLLAAVVAVVPHLGSVALLGQRARARGLEYPVNGVKDLTDLWGDEDLVVHGHSVSPAAIRRHLPDEFFPIDSEEDLLRRVYLAVVACTEQTAHAARDGQERDADGPPVMRFLDDPDPGGSG